MGGCPQEWRTEVSQLGTVSDRCRTFIPPDASVLLRRQRGIPSAQATRDRPQWVSGAVHVSGQSNFRRVTANRTDQAATEDPGEWFSH
jgi:hypothetical protein